MLRRRLEAACNKACSLLLLESADIVLAAGSHHSPDILAAFKFFSPAMRVEPAPGGGFIAEDLLTNCMASGEFLEGPGVAGTFMERTKQLIDQLNAHNAWNLTQHATNPRKSLPCKRRPALLLPSAYSCLMSSRRPQLASTCKTVWLSSSAGRTRPRQTW